MTTAIRTLVYAVLALAAATVATSCGGSDSTGPGGGDGSYYFRFNANGSLVSYTQQASLVATFTQAGSQYAGIFTGYDATTNAHVQIYSAAPIATTSYSGYGVSGTALVGVLLGYDDATGTLYTSGGGTVEANATITQLTASTVRGTFSGRLRANGRADILVTNGEFYLPRIN